jgi:hypothetical protein
VSPKKPSTRADAVRQRRKRDDERRLVVQTLERPTRRRTAPPATARNISVDAATVRTPPKAGRRYDALAAAPVRSLHLPAIAIPRVRVGWRLLSFFLVLLLGGAFYYAWTQPTFKAADAKLIGNQFLTADEVNSALGLAGRHIFMIVPEEVEKSLRLNFPEITSAHATVDLPNRVTVTITERQPVIRWVQGNTFAWVDADGVAFRPRGEVSGLVVVSALGTPPSGPTSESDPFAPAPFVAPEIVQLARALNPYIPQGSVLLYDPKYGIGWTDPRGWTVWFGSKAGQVEVKLRVYIVLVESLAQRGITPVFINVAYSNAPYYRLGQ